MSAHYLDPAQKLLKETMRRGGPMDTIKFRFICQQCGQRITLTARQGYAGKRPACKKCGPSAAITKDTTHNASSQT